jgi:hypothetical protein
VVILIILLWPPSSVALVLAGADYADNLLVPQNVLGWKGLEAIDALARARPPLALFPPARLEPILPLRKLSQPGDWEKLIKDVKKSQFKHKTILIVLSLHGGSDSKGAYLCPDRMAGTRDRFDLRQVIKSLDELSPEKEKILVIEGAQVPSNWQLGMLHDDFARRLEEMDREGDIRSVRNLWVLSAAGVDQRCWASEGLGRTVFCHYLIEALRGRAVGDDGRLSLHGLHRYLGLNVRNWVWKARGAVQEPVLLPRARPESEGVGGAGDGTSSAKALAAETTPRRPANRIELPAIAWQSPLPVPGPTVQGPPDAWDAYVELDSRLPHPMVYTPGEWARFKAELLRFDELSRAGASEQAAATIAPMINLSKAALERGRHLREILSSVENNLAMSALEGPAGPLEVPAPEFSAFWRARTGSDAAKAWKALVDASPGAARGQVSVRIRGDRFLLFQASQDPGKDLTSVADKLAITRGNDYPQPAEAHFVRMLARRLTPVGDQPKKRLAAIGQAISLRRGAERTALGVSREADDYSYCEQVNPWIREHVKAADSQRRLGEDQIFSSDESAWNQAASALTRARDLYAGVDERAAAIRKALETRDRALARLPEISHWLADRGPDEIQGELVSDVEGLWEKTHLLTAELEKPTDSPDLTLLRGLARDVSEGVDRISSRPRDVARRLDVTGDKEDWEEVTALAAIPWGEINGRRVREKIWEWLGDIEKHDRELAAIEQKVPIKLTDEQSGQEEKRVRARATVQARIAMAVLGKRWFDDRDEFSIGEQEDYASTVRRVLEAGDLDPDRGQDWWRIISSVGDRVGRRWERLAEAIDRPVDERNGIADFRVFSNQMAKADRLERLVEGGSPRPTDASMQVSVLLREARVHDLLIGMADRAWEDHWYDEDGKERYYHAVGALFIQDAEKYFPYSAPVRDARARMERKGRIAVAVQPRITFTSETEGELQYRVADEGIVPEGLPVVRPTAEPPLEFDPSSTGYRLVPRGKPGATAAITVGNPLGDRFEKDPRENRPRVVPSSFQLDGFFRGQEFNGTTAAVIHPVPDTVAIGPAPTDPPDASIAVRASKEIINRFGDGTGSIAIVLDCSDSMLDPTESGRTKFKEAQLALREVLRSVPARTRLSLWTFSQLPSGVQEVYKGDPLENEPELTIKPLLRMTPWDPSQTEAIVAQVSQLQPYLSTPLVTAMWTAAKRDLELASGLKTLLVLTDGDDNELEKFKPKYNPNRMTVKDFIVSGFKTLGIAVNMVFFTPRTDPQQIQNARKRFGEALAQLEPPGSFKTAKDRDELIATLKQGLIQKLTCQLLRPDGTPVNDQPLDVTDPDEEEAWCRALRPGSYRVRVHADTVLDQDVDLRSGDRLIIELVEDEARKVGFRRGLYSDTSEFAVKTGAWRLTRLANQIRQGGGEQRRLQVAAALEREPKGTSSGEIRQVGPGMAWYRLGADLVEFPERKFMTRWRQRVFYPGPVWHFDVPRWIPGPAGDRLATPILEAWWTNAEDRPQPHLDVPFDAAGDPGKLPRGLRLDDDRSVTLESTRLEHHRVEVAPLETLTKPCLVIRLAFPAGHRHLVDPASLKGLKVVGYEHRFYTEAGKYTGLFWPVTPPEFQRLTGLGLVDLDRLLENAEKSKATLRMKLVQPTEESPIPIPPIVPPRAG